MSPQPVQLRRTRGWRKPAGAIVVSRPSKWGNPWLIRRAKTAWWHGWDVVHVEGNRHAGTFRDYDSARYAATQMYRLHLSEHPELREAIRLELASHDLACWCPLPEPGRPDHCHRAVLLERANRMGIR